MNTLKLLAWLILPIVALILVGGLVLSLLHSLLSLVFYLIVGALVVGGGVYLYQRAKRAVGPGTRTRARLDAAAETYRMRDR
jgi:membrane protein required for beta-lactamase induction